MKLMKSMFAAVVVASMTGFSHVAEGRTYEPKVVGDALVAVCYRNSSAPVIALLKDLCKSAFVNSLGKGEAAEFNKFLKDAGLEDKSLEWVVGTFSDVNSLNVMKQGKMPMFMFGIALRIDHDAAKLAAAMKASVERSGDGDRVVDIEVAGLKAWNIVSPVLSKEGVSFVFTSLDGQLVLYATDQKSLAGLVKLYRDGADVNAAFGNMASGIGEVAHLCLPMLGKFIVNTAKVNGYDLSVLDQMIPDGKKLVSGLGALNIVFAANGADASVKASVVAANADDAETIRTLVKTSLMPLKAQAKAEANGGEPDEENRLIFEMLDRVKVAGEGKDVVVTVPVSAAYIRKVLDTAATTSM